MRFSSVSCSLCDPKLVVLFISTSTLLKTPFYKKNFPECNSSILPYIFIIEASVFYLSESSRNSISHLTKAVLIFMRARICFEAIDIVSYAYALFQALWISQYLSIYNASSWCKVHQNFAQPLPCLWKPTPDREIVLIIFKRPATLEL